MGMTELERYQATVNHRRPDKLLYHMSFTPDLEKRVRQAEGLDERASLAHHFGLFDPVSMSLKKPVEAAEPDWTVYFRDVEISPKSYFDKNGGLHVPSGEYHFTRLISPLRNARSLREIEEYPWPDWRGYQSDHFAATVRQAHAAGRMARVRATHMYEDAWQVRGYEEFLADMIVEPDWAHYVLDRFKQRNRLVAVAAAEAGADELHTGDDVANQRTLMFSPSHWREFIKSKWAEVYAAAKAINPNLRIWYHSDGNIADIIPELIEIGVDIFNPLQPECLDVEEVKRRYGSRIVIDGVIGTQTVMPFGSPDDVRACVKERVRTLGADGALILAPTHVLEPEVPIANIAAFAEACREYGGA